MRMLIKQRKEFITSAGRQHFMDRHSADIDQRVHLHISRFTETGMRKEIG